MVGAALVAWIALGCGKPGPGVVVDLNGDPALGVLSPELEFSQLDPVSGAWWESVPWSEDPPVDGVTWIAYTPRTQIHISHPLGRRPVGVLVYLSFVDSGASPSLAAGDLARVIEVTDTDITVWNDTNGSYFARIVLF